MRVLMISKACVVGMYQRKLEELAKLPELRVLVVVPSFWRNGRQILPLERAHTAGYELRVLPMVFNGSFHLHFYRQLGQVMQQFQPEIVHIDEEPYNLATLQAMRLAEKNRARAVFFTWQNLNKRYPFPFSQIERYNLAHARLAIAGNREAEQVLRAKGYTGPVRVIPQFGVDPELYQPRTEQDGPGNALMVGYMGRLVEEKGLQVLLRSLAGLEGNWRLQVVGSGPYGAALRELAVELGIQARVNWLGYVPSTEAPGILRSLDVLVLPSLTRANWKEQFGRVLIEAMACEVPVIGSSSGEIPNLIGDAGIVFPEGDAVGLRDSLRWLVSDPGLRSVLGQRGRQRVLERFTQAQVAADTYAVYKEMISPGARED